MMLNPERGREGEREVKLICQCRGPQALVFIRGRVVFVSHTCSQDQHRREVVFVSHTHLVSINTGERSCLCHTHLCLVFPFSPLYLNPRVSSVHRLSMFVFVLCLCHVCVCVMFVFVSCLCLCHVCVCVNVCV